MTRFEVESAGQHGRDERQVGSLPGQAVVFESGITPAPVKKRENGKDRRVGDAVEPASRRCRREGLEGDESSRVQVSQEQIVPDESSRDEGSRLADVSGLVSDWIWEIDDGLCLTYASDRVTETLGYLPKDLIGKSLADLAVDPDALAALFEGDHPAPPFRGCEIELNSRGGEARLFRISGLPIYRRGGQSLAGYRGTAQDITDLSLQTRALHAAVGAADAAKRLKSEFFANTSHELRTPLNAIIGFTEIMHAGHFGPIGSARYRDYLGNVLESARHLLSLIDDILDVAETEAGEIDLNEALVDPAEILRQAYCLAGGAAKRADVALKKDIVPLPYVLADGGKIRQILMNILSNAIKFTPAGGEARLSAHISAEGELVFRVEDTGIGIAGASREELLTPFEQSDSRQRCGNQGPGLGLPLSDALIKRHGGRLDFHSVQGEGTVVTVTLPSHRVLQDDAAENQTFQT